MGCLSNNDYTLLPYDDFMNYTQVENSVNSEEHEFVRRLAQTSTKI